MRKVNFMYNPIALASDKPSATAARSGPGYGAHQRTVAGRESPSVLSQPNYSDKRGLSRRDGASEEQQPMRRHDESVCVIVSRSIKKTRAVV